MRRIALALVAVALAWIGGRALFDALRSDESKIRARIEAACEGFGATRMNPVLELFAQDFVDETSGFHREDVRRAVAGAFFSEKDPKTRGFPHRAALVPDSLVIERAQDSSDKAAVRFAIRITDTSGDSERTSLEFTVAGTMVDGDDGWQLARVTHDRVAGSWKLR
jgi:hypothetical protein